MLPGCLQGLPASALLLLSQRDEALASDPEVLQMWPEVGFVIGWDLFIRFPPPQSPSENQLVPSVLKRLFWYLLGCKNKPGSTRR